MSKRYFIHQFISILSGMGYTLKHIAGAFRRESLRYKYLRLGGHDPKIIYAGLNNLKHRGILKEKRPGEYAFTSRGKSWYQKSAIRYRPLKKRPWDGIWRLVVFDIPNDYNRARHTLRARLKFLGFQMIQKSVFVIPYPCATELGELCGQLRISDYVCLITASNLGSFEDRMRKTFNL